MASEAILRDEDRPGLLARIAGVAWLVAIGTGLFAELYVRPATIVHGDAAATAARIAALQPLFRLGIAADLLGIVASLVFTLLLYPLLRPAGRNASMAAAGFGLAGCAVAGANLVNFFAPLILVDLSSAGSPAAVDPWVLVFLRLYSVGYNLSIAFFAVQVAILGWLILRSTFLPAFLGILFLVEGGCNLAHSLLVILVPVIPPRLDSLLLLPGLFAEGGMTLWLLIAGVNVRAWHAQRRQGLASAPA
ncbi:MAG TPA: DUF4386 domain-containing protein [Allosphingosinicella sp.]|nr:DUF4386 domain-containing protein [Allosphingosinicella sp.]